MHQKYILRQVEPDRDNIIHDRPPLWIIADPPWHFDAVGERPHHNTKKIWGVRNPCWFASP